MPDDGSDAHVITTGRSVRPAGESRLGNFVEALLTYMSGLTIFLPVNAFIIFGPFEFDTAESQAVFWPMWFAFCWLYYTVNAHAAVIGSQARFSSKLFRFFADTGASAAPLILPVLMFFLALARVYSPSYIDGMVAGFIVWICCLDLYAHSTLVQTAVRRVREGVVDK